MTPVRQRADGDCGIAALAMIAEVEYEDAYVAVVAVDPKRRGKSGLHNHELARAAQRLGLTLTGTRRYDLDDDDGILRVRWNGPRGKRNPGGHFVAVREGLILCPGSSTPVRWREYLEQNNGRACSLLKQTV